MKKSLPYVLIGVIVLALLVLFLLGYNSKNKTLDERLSFRKKDKIPYGLYAAYNSLSSFFPKASVGTSRKEPGYWDDLSEYQKGQALIIVVPQFFADEYEMKNMIRFAQNGNTVFISAMSIPYEISKMLRCNINTTGNFLYYLAQNSIGLDTLTVSLSDPPYGRDALFTYPGKKLDGYFSRIDSSITTVLGYDERRRPNFIQLRIGTGSIYIHLAPMTFTNYFLLHKNNFAYYEKVLSVIPASTDKVVWDEYYRFKKNKPPERGNWLSVFLKHPPLKWALLVALLTLLLYVLSEIRRKQRPIPVINPPKNDSFDFVKTIGRLYHDKGDHKNLSRKMAAYFLEHIRNKYKLPTNHLNDEFAANLSFKTGVNEAEIKSILSFITELEHLDRVSEQQLAAFHRQLEKFYQHS